MTACAAYGCINRPSMRKPGVTFHSFPKDEKRRKKWLKAISRENWSPTKSSKVCSEHFPEEMIDRTSLSCVRLKENAVPTTVFGDSLLEDVDKINEQNLSDELHKNAESASLIIQELFSIEAESSESEGEVETEKVKVQTLSTSLAIQNSVCITKETKSEVRCKRNSTSPSVAVQNSMSVSLDRCKKRKTSTSLASRNSVSGAINENEEPELSENPASTVGMSSNQSSKQKRKTVVQKSVSVTPNANQLAVQKLKKHATFASKSMQNSPTAPDLNSISHLIEAIKSSSGNAAKIVVIEGVKDKDSAQKKKIAKLKKALKAEKKKVKVLREKIKNYQKTLSNVTDLLNDIKNQKVDEQE